MRWMAGRILWCVGCFLLHVDVLEGPFPPGGCLVAWRISSFSGRPDGGENAPGDLGIR